ncbi:DUF7341 domain-containing protein [Mycobacterium kansasii]
MTVTATRPIPTDGNLPQAKRLLGDAISALIDPRPQHLDGHTHWLNPLYHELREAIDAQRIGSSRGKPESQAPLWVAALAALIEIDTLAHRHEPHWPISDCDDYPTVQRFRIIDSRKWRPQDTDIIEELTKELVKLADTVNKLFAVPPKFLDGPCPHCQAKIARRLNDEGEYVRGPALRIDINGPDDCSATCNNCGEHWDRRELRFLGRLLGCPEIEGVIET